MNPEKEKPPFYLCAGPEAWGMKVESVKKVAGHWVGGEDKWRIVWPGKVASETISPETFLELKEKLKTKAIILVDRLVGVDRWVVITDHVNRTGPNFLIGKTPYRGLPRFPDLSHLYEPTEGFQKVIVHTVGPERFGDVQEESGTIWSEAAGLIAPVAHYVGLKIIAVGG
ncbi:MAG: purine-nucleoside phosphorylase, partial [FCB group bacterium]|nr:purine-nucleoside phosphorylase [FCB group bacterium]